MAFPLCEYLLVGIGNIIIKKYSFALLALILVGALFSLGVWQLYRLSEKEDLLEQIAYAQSHAHRGLDQAKVYEKVELTGKFMPETFVLQSKTQDGKAGVWWVSPFVTDQDVIIMVVRGWTQQKEAHYPPLQPMTLTGTLRETQRGYFQPDNQNDQWFTLYIPDMEKALNEYLYPYYLILDGPQEGAPLYPVSPLPQLRNNHLSYALTWFTLAFIVSMMTLLFLRKRKGNDCGSANHHS